MLVSMSLLSVEIRLMLYQNIKMAQVEEQQNSRVWKWLLEIIKASPPQLKQIPYSRWHGKMCRWVYPEQENIPKCFQLLHIFWHQKIMWWVSVEAWSEHLSIVWTTIPLCVVFVEMWPFFFYGWMWSCLPSVVFSISRCYKCSKCFLRNKKHILLQKRLHFD